MTKLSGSWTRVGWRQMVGALGGVLASILPPGLSGQAVAQQRPAVDSTLASYGPVAGLSGSLTIAGSDTMQPLLLRLASEFRQRQREVKLAVEGGGSETVLRAFLEGVAQARRGGGNVSGHESSAQVLIMASSRELTQDEVRQFVSRHGYEPTAVPIAVDAVAIYVHKDTPLTGLTLEQLDAIFSKTRKRGYQKKIETWGQLGLPSNWEKARIQLYGRDQKSGTRAFVREHVLENGEFDSSVKEEPGAASLILAVSRDPFGMGYGGLGMQASSVRAVPLAEKAGVSYVTPNFDTTSDGTYPLRRFLFLYVNKPPKSALQPVVQEFLKFANSREGQEAVIKAGFYQVPARQVSQNLAAVTASVND